MGAPSASQTRATNQRAVHHRLALLISERRPAVFSSPPARPPSAVSVFNAVIGEKRSGVECGRRRRADNGRGTDRSKRRFQRSSTTTNAFRSERRFDSFPAPHDVFFESGRPVVDHRANASSSSFLSIRDSCHSSGGRVFTRPPRKYDIFTRSPRLITCDDARRPAAAAPLVQAADSAGVVSVLAVREWGRALLRPAHQTSRFRTPCCPSCLLRPMGTWCRVVYTTQPLPPLCFMIGGRKIATTHERWGQKIFHSTRPIAFEVGW